MTRRKIGVHDFLERTLRVRFRVRFSQRTRDVPDRAVAMGLSRSVGDRVQATTFHAFAADVLRQNGDLIWCVPVCMCVCMCVVMSFSASLLLLLPVSIWRSLVNWLCWFFPFDFLAGDVVGIDVGVDCGSGGGGCGRQCLLLLVAALVKVTSIGVRHSRTHLHGYVPRTCPAVTLLPPPPSLAI